jgi:hypothetical protein
MLLHRLAWIWLDLPGIALIAWNSVQSMQAMLPVSGQFQGAIPETKALVLNCPQSAIRNQHSAILELLIRNQLITNTDLIYLP